MIRTTMETSVTIEASKLLRLLRKNREAHLKNYEEAFNAYLEAVKSDLEYHLKALNNPEVGFADFIHTGHLRWDVPEDHTPEYDQAIKMVELSNKPDVQLDQISFREYVMDNWSWTPKFEQSIRRYVG